MNRRKAVVRDWFGNGEPVNIMGDIEMYQMSEYDAVNVEVNVQGLQQVNDYYIHMVSRVRWLATASARNLDPKQAFPIP